MKTKNRYSLLHEVNICIIQKQAHSILWFYVFVFNNIYEMNQGSCQMLNYLQWYVSVPTKKKLQFNIKLCALNLRNFSFKFARAPEIDIYILLFQKSLRTSMTPTHVRRSLMGDVRRSLHSAIRKKSRVYFSDLYGVLFLGSMVGISTSPFPFRRHVSP